MMARSRADVELGTLILMYGTSGLCVGLAIGLNVAGRFVDDWRLEMLMVGAMLVALVAYFMGRLLSIRFMRAWGLYSNAASMGRA